MNNPWNLSERENEVMHAMAITANGCSKVAARQLNLSHRTVEEHVQRAMRKMGVNRRIAAVLLWDREHRSCPQCFAHRLAEAA